jgi:hypothetical protein
MACIQYFFENRGLWFKKNGVGIIYLRRLCFVCAFVIMTLVEASLCMNIPCWEWLFLVIVLILNGEIFRLSNTSIWLYYLLPITFEVDEVNFFSFFILWYTLMGLKFSFDRLSYLFHKLIISASRIFNILFLLSLFYSILALRFGFTHTFEKFTWGNFELFLSRFGKRVILWILVGVKIILEWYH